MAIDVNRLVKDALEINAIEGYIKDEIKAHMNAQPYSISCARCGSKLSVHVSIDKDFDLDVEVEPCENCCKVD